MYNIIHFELLAERIQLKIATLKFKRLIHTHICPAYTTHAPPLKQCSIMVIHCLTHFWDNAASWGWNLTPLPINLMKFEVNAGMTRCQKTKMDCCSQVNHCQQYQLIRINYLAFCTYIPQSSMSKDQLETNEDCV